MTGREIERATPQPKLATHREPTPRCPTATCANPPKILNKPTANSHRKHIATATATTANHKSISITHKTNRQFLPQIWSVILSSNGGGDPSHKQWRSRWERESVLTSPRDFRCHHHRIASPLSLPLNSHRLASIVTALSRVSQVKGGVREREIWRRWEV